MLNHGAGILLAPEPMAHDVFISYSSKNKNEADATCAMLESRAIRCWVAPRDIRPGADWGESIVDAINGCRVMVLVFSRHANDSVQIKREVERVVNRGIPIIPLRIEDVLPAKSLEYFISTSHWLDAFSPPLERHLQYLADTVEQILRGPEAGPLPAPPPAPRPVPWWKSNPKRLGLVGAAAAVGIALVLLLVRPATNLEAKGLEAFLGTWRLETLEIAPGAPDLMSAFPLYNLHQAAIASEGMSVRSTIDRFGQYDAQTVAEDRGRYSLDGDSLVFTSAQGGASDQVAMILHTAEDAIPSIGLAAGDTTLALSRPAANQTMWVRKASSGRAPDSLVGTWVNQLGTPYVITLELGEDGSYLIRFVRNERGTLEAQDGKLTRMTPFGPVTGRYLFEGQDTFTSVEPFGKSVWKREQQ